MSKPLSGPSASFVPRLGAGQPSLAMLVDDGLHPSAAMYRLWMEQALPVAADLLTDPTAA